MKITIIYKNGTKHNVNNLNILKIDKFPERTYLYYEVPNLNYTDTISFTNEFVYQIVVN
jgi:hypothetical protein